MNSNTMLGLYFPVIYSSDFWILRKQYKLLESNMTNGTTITLRAGTLAKENFGY